MSTIRAVASAAASTAVVPLSVLDEAGNALTPGPNDRIEIIAVTLAVTSGATTYTLFHDADADNTLDSGEALLVLNGNANTTVFCNFAGAPILCPRASDLHVVPGASATYSLTVTGVLRRLGG